MAFGVTNRTSINVNVKVADHESKPLSALKLLLVFLTPFSGHFAPTSRSPMCKLFRFSESLGKCNEKKWSQIWKLLLTKGVKSPRQKTPKFFHCFTPFKRLFAPTSQSPMSKLFTFLESPGKSNRKRIWKLLLISIVILPRENSCIFLAIFALLAGFLWYQCFHPHRSRDALSPVCGIFLKYFISHVLFTHFFTGKCFKVSTK